MRVGCASLQITLRAGRRSENVIRLRYLAASHPGAPYRIDSSTRPRDFAYFVLPRVARAVPRARCGYFGPARDTPTSDISSSAVGTLRARRSLRGAESGPGTRYHRRQEFAAYPPQDLRTSNICDRARYSRAFPVKLTHMPRSAAPLRVRIDPLQIASRREVGARGIALLGREFPPAV